MTCVPSEPQFRLLDWLVGWEEDSHDRLTGLGDPGGVRLACGSDGIDAAALDPLIPPPQLAPGCEPCTWFLATRPLRGASRILELDGCSNDWQPWPGKAFPIPLARAVAVTVDRHLLAVADAGRDRVWVLHLPGGQVAAEIAVQAPADLSFDGRGGLIVASGNGRRLLRFTANGRFAGDWRAELPDEVILRVAHDQDGRLWLATDAGEDRFHLWATEHACSGRFAPQSLEALAAAFERTDGRGSCRRGFCIERGASRTERTLLCWNWFGRPIEEDCVLGAGRTGFARQGQLLTTALDSGVPRCVWHRLRLDADIPHGTRVELAVATADDAQPAAQGNSVPPWDTFPGGVPHPQDWQVVAAGASDALIRAPAGRYLFLRLRLSGNGSATPRVRRIHLDFPRATSNDLLPAVYHEEPDANDFTARFLALFDASLGTVEASVSRFPALLDGARAKAEVLPWIAGFLSVALDETWDTKTRRRMLAAAPELFRQRGTRAGMARSVRLAFDLDADPLITEYGLERAWGALAATGTPRPDDARLGAVRLFSRRAARLTLGGSELGRAPVRAYGNPDTDPHDVGAFRFSVALPSTLPERGAALRRLVDGQKPAHTLATVRLSQAGGFQLGIGLALGIDTLFVRPGPAALGDPALRLDGGAVVGGHLPPGPIAGLTARVGQGPHPISTHHHGTCRTEGMP